MVLLMGIVSLLGFPAHLPTLQEHDHWSPLGRPGWQVAAACPGGNCIGV